jgi:hypothetical protein
MSPRIRWLLLASAWAGVTFGVLALERIPGDYAHDYCGPWGCLPPLQALAAMHGFWLMLMVPAVVWLLQRLSPAGLCLAGAFAFSVGAFGLAVVMGRGLLGWLDATGGIHRYAVQRMLYVAATATDLPFGQVAAVGVVWWLAGRSRMRGARAVFRGAGAPPALAQPVPGARDSLTTASETAGGMNR